MQREKIWCWKVYTITFEKIITCMMGPTASFRHINSLLTSEIPMQSLEY